MSFKNILLIAFCFLTGGIFAQSEQQQIRLLDLENNKAIDLVSYEYGDQQGISDDNGFISFNYKEGTLMSLSHVKYGIWLLNDKEVKEVMTQKIYYLSLPVNFHPVTIIGLRPQGRQPEDGLKIEYQDRLEHDGADILNQIPAFNSIRKSGTYGFDPVFRGFKYDQLNIVLDGAQSATAACPNRMDPPTSQMAPNMMDRIEVLKGPYALRFGTGFGATINFIPTRLHFTSETQLNGRLSTGYESNGNIVRGESQIGLSGERYNVNLFGSWSQGDDYTSGNGDIVQGDFLRGSFGTDMGFKLTSNQQIRVSATYNRTRDADFAALQMDLRNDDTWMFNARHDIQVNGDKLQNWNTTVFGSFVDHLMDNLLKPLDPRMLNASNNAKTNNYGGRTEGTWIFGNSKLYGGADLRVEGAKGTRVREFLRGPNAGKTFYDNAWQDSRISKLGVFAEYQINGNAFDYVLSGRLEMNKADVNDPSDEFIEIYPETNINQFNPSFSFGILKDISNQVNMGLWLGRAQRSGGLTERFINYFTVGQDPYEMLGNPQLNPEVNNQVDLTFQWKPNRKSAISFDVFAAYLQDYISSAVDSTLKPRLPASPGVRRYINIDDAFKTGFEISWTQQLFAGLHHQLGFAYTYGEDLVLKQPLPEIAPFDIRYALSGSYFNGKLKPQAVLRYVAEQSRISNEFGESVSPSFALLDIKIGYQLSNALSINAGVKNLLNENYYEHLNRSASGSANPIFAPGRNVFANLNFIF